MATIPNILYRAPNLVVMTIPDKAGVSRFRIRAHKTLTGAATAGATDVVFEVDKGAHFKSESVQKKGRGYPYAPGSTRGHAWCAFDPDDFYDPTTAGVAQLPPDDQYGFYRVEEFSIAANAYLAEGPILIVPPAGFWSTQDPAMALQVSIPQTSGNEADLKGVPAPAAAIRIHMPGALKSGHVRNLDNKVLYYSLGDKAPMARIPNSGEISLFSGVSDMLVLATTDAGGCDVSALLGLSSGGG